MAQPQQKNNNNNFGGLENYETVKQRKDRIKADHPNSVIYPIAMSNVDYAQTYFMAGALVFKDKEKMNRTPEVISAIVGLAEKVTPSNIGLMMASIGMITGADGIGYSLSLAGGRQADKNAWVENCEESAIGRALDNCGYHGNGKASRDEMEKVVHMQQVTSDRQRLETEIQGILMDMTSQQRDVNQIYMVCQQSVKPFTTIQELSVPDLERVLNILKTA